MVMNNFLHSQATGVEGAFDRKADERWRRTDEGHERVEGGEAGRLEGGKAGRPKG